MLSAPIDLCYGDAVIACGCFSGSSARVARSMLKWLARVAIKTSISCSEKEAASGEDAALADGMLDDAS